MIYLDNGATSYRKPQCVYHGVLSAMQRCANPGRGGYAAANAAAAAVFHCRQTAAQMFDCQPEQVVFTSNCTHGLNIGIHSLVKPGSRVVISGFEHNAVTRPLHLLGAKLTVAGRRLFDWDDTLTEFEKALQKGQDAAVFTHVSNVFGYILPVEQMAALCRSYGVPFIIDAAQSAGVLPVKLGQLGADFVAMPGHKSLLGPQGTGMLLCGRIPQVFMAGGTGSDSMLQQMPSFLPDRGEAGTLNVPGIAGLDAAMGYLQKTGMEKIAQREHRAAYQCGQMLEDMGLLVFSGPHQAGTVSFVPGVDCEEAAQMLAQEHIAVRAGLHCAPLAHESAGTAQSGTVRVSFGLDASAAQVEALRRAIVRCGLV